MKNPNNLEVEVQILQTQMTKDHLCPSEPIIVDNQRHEFCTYINGKKEAAFYIAMSYPGGFKSPILSCNYGLVNRPIQYMYTSPDREKI